MLVVTGKSRIGEALRIFHHHYRAFLSFWFIGLLLINLPVWATERTNLPTLRYNLGGTSAWVPYGYHGDPNNQGIFAEVIHAIMKLTHIPYEFYYYPPKRAEMAIESGKLDFDFMSPSWFKDGFMGEEYATTIAIFELVEYVVTLPKNAENFATPEAIYGKRIGTVAGYSYYDDDKFTRVDFLSESKLIEGLARQRFDAVILEGMAARYWANANQVSITLASVHSQGDIVIRLRQEYKHLIPVLNQAIVDLRQSGQIAKILQRYNVD